MFINPERKGLNDALKYKHECFSIHNITPKFHANSADRVFPDSDVALFLRPVLQKFVFYTYTAIWKY